MKILGTTTVILSLLLLSTPAKANISDLHWLLGDWIVTTFVMNEEQKFQAVPATSFYKARLNRDENSITAQYYEQNPKGFYGIHLISQKGDGQYDHYYLNAKAKRKLSFIGTLKEDGYYLERFGGYGDNGKYYREVDQRLSEDKIVKKIYESEDGQSNWKEGDYYFVFDRAKSAESAE